VRRLRCGHCVSPPHTHLSYLPLISPSVCVTSILRFTTLNLATAHTDVMWQSINSSMWTVIEYNLSIIAASMPALRRPLASLFPILLGRTSNSSATHDFDHRIDNYTRAPSTASTASTWTSRFSSGRRGLWADEKQCRKDSGPSEKNRRSGMRTEIFDGESTDVDMDFDFDFEKHGIPPVPPPPTHVPGDQVSMRDWSRNGIWKTTEVRVEPEAQGDSLQQRAEMREQVRMFPM
jgi:hypothetical protein